MMGNFLTTLGRRARRRPGDVRGARAERRPPARQRRQPAPRQPLRLARGRDARERPIDELIDSQAEANFWDPSTQLRVIKKKGASRRPTRSEPESASRLGRLRRHERRRRAAGGASRRGGLAPAAAADRGPAGAARSLLDGAEVLLLCSNNYLGLADHPRVREAAAEAAERCGAGAGASRLISGNMSLHRRLEQRLAAFKGYEAALLFGSGYLANTGTVAALAGRGEVVFSDELNHASIIDGCRLVAGRDLRLPPRATSSTSPGGCARPASRARADRHRRRLLDGRRRRAARPSWPSWRAATAAG